MSVRIAGFKTETRSQHFTNISLEDYLKTNALDMKKERNIRF
jgi:hypothetical protein